MDRFLVLFARAPEREAREKGFATEDAAGLFSAFASGWLEAAAKTGARLVVAAPPEDLAAWRRRLSSEAGIVWLAQRGRSFGDRLRHAAEGVAGLGGHAVLVGGDVAPEARAAREAFEALERGADAALAPADDGGVSLLGVSMRDVDLLERLAVGQRDAFAILASGLAARGRSVAVVCPAPDVDGRAALRRLLRAAPVAISRSMARGALRVSPPPPAPPPLFVRPSLLASPSGLRAPPPPA